MSIPTIKLTFRTLLRRFRRSKVRKVSYKYDLRRFNTIGSISYDHPDPSIFLVLQSLSDTPGVDSKWRHQHFNGACAACLSSGHGEPPALPHTGFSPTILIWIKKRISVLEHHIIHFRGRQGLEPALPGLGASAFKVLNTKKTERASGYPSNHSEEV